MTARTTLMDGRLAACGVGGTVLTGLANDDVRRRCLLKPGAMGGTMGGLVLMIGYLSGNSCSPAGPRKRPQ